MHCNITCHHHLLLGCPWEQRFCNAQLLSPTKKLITQVLQTLHGDALSLLAWLAQGTAHPMLLSRAPYNLLLTPHRTAPAKPFIGSRWQRKSVLHAPRRLPFLESLKLLFCWSRLLCEVLFASTPRSPIGTTLDPVSPGLPLHFLSPDGLHRKITDLCSWYAFSTQSLMNRQLPAMLTGYPRKNPRQGKGRDLSTAGQRHDPRSPAGPWTHERKLQ